MSTEIERARKTPSAKKQVATKKPPTQGSVDGSERAPRDWRCFTGGHFKLFREEIGIERCASGIWEAALKHIVEPCIHDYMQQTIYYTAYEGRKLRTSADMLRAISDINRVECPLGPLPPPPESGSKRARSGEEEASGGGAAKRTKEVAKSAAGRSHGDASAKKSAKVEKAKKEKKKAAPKEKKEKKAKAPAKAEKAKKSKKEIKAELQAQEEEERPPKGEASDSDEEHRGLEESDDDGSDEE